VHKRSVETALAGPLLLIALPLLGIAAVAISIKSAAGAIVSQLRIGHRFRRFTHYKLRTMQIEKADAHHTLLNDPRITRVGRWLAGQK
jgi:lipopolysaccharide/colanic/teichoic acid biosynthesis glycosyltransferase